MKNDSGASSTVYLVNLEGRTGLVALAFHTQLGAMQLVPDSFILAPYGVAQISGDELDLPNGTYSVVIESDCEIRSIVRTPATGAPEGLVTYAGQSSGATNLHFGPVYKNASGLSSSITIMNTSPAPADATITYLNNAGESPHSATLSLQPSEAGTFSTSMLPDGFEGWARVTADRSLVGILELSDSPANTVREARGPLGPAAAPNCLPRVLKHADQGTGPRSTALFVVNPETSAVDLQISFSSAMGTTSVTIVRHLAPGGADIIKLADLDVLPDGTWAACTKWGQPVMIGALTTLDNAGLANETTYDAASASESGLPFTLILPRLVSDETTHTVFTVQNFSPAAAYVTVRLRNLTGSQVFEETVTLPAMGWKAYDQSQMSELGASFLGSGEISSDGPLNAIVDELMNPPPPTAITDLEASIDAGKVELEWGEVTLDVFNRLIDDVTYDVYRAEDAPYFVPSASDAAYAPDLTGSPFHDPDTTVLMDEAHSTYYVVKSVYEAQGSAASNRVGVFAFTLQPGTDPTANMVLVPAGTFQRGCDPDHNDEASCAADQLPLRPIYLDAYRIDRTEVTNVQYAQCVAAGACTPPGSTTSYTRVSYYDNSDYADYPVIHVSWHQAAAYCAWIDKRLPTEAEWEKAARGSGTPYAYPWGDSTPDCTLANYWYDPDGSPCVGDTVAVGSYPTGASAYGVLDMAGNVWEWVSDWYSSTYFSESPDSNPQGPASGTYKVNLGGYFRGYRDTLHVAYRNSWDPVSQGPSRGFRCAALP